MKFGIASLMLASLMIISCGDGKSDVAEPVVSTTYETLSGSQSLTLSTDGKAEWQQGEDSLPGTHTRADDKVRVVFADSGSERVMVYTRLPQGLKSEDQGVILYSPLSLAEARSLSSPGSTPTDSFHAVQYIVRHKNWEVMADFIPPSQLDGAEDDFKKGLEGPGATMMATMFEIELEELKVMDYRSFLAMMFEKMSEKDSKQTALMMEGRIKHKEINGNQATLIVKKGDDEETVKLVEEGGTWYMADFGK